MCIREINNNNNMSLCIREINNNNKVSLLIEARLNAGNWEHIFFVRLSQRGGGVGCGGRWGWGEEGRGRGDDHSMIYLVSFTSYIF